MRSSISYTLAATLENLTLLGVAALSGTGTASANVMVGNGGANLLRGLDGADTLDGGLGADRLFGGLGNDLYLVDNAGDLMVEEGTGIDTVQASISFTLGAKLENLTLVGSALNGTGNALGNTLTGNDLANVLDGGVGADRLLGGLGDDTYIVDDTGDVVTETSTTGGTDTIRASVSRTLTANVENLVLTGGLDLDGAGNGLANSLTGNDGDNRLDGGTGADSMAGGFGDDTYVVDHAGDVVTEAAGSGVDTVQSMLASYGLGAEMENLQLYGASLDTAARSGTGNALANMILGSNGAGTLAGGAGDDRLLGNGGNDSLDGGEDNDWLDGGLGDDAMAGGAGNDTYVVDSLLDTVTEGLNGGVDTVLSAVSTILGANVEHLTLTGNSVVDGQGNVLANSLTGNGRNNNLDGGAGADTMAGGLGDDTYGVDDNFDVVAEALDAGVDHVRSSVSYALGVGVEKLTLLGTADIGASGNELDNTLVGNGGANIIAGGLGRDTMTGGAGADTFIFDSSLESQQGVARDHITDFLQGADRIDLAGISTLAVDQIFHFRSDGTTLQQLAGDLIAVRSTTTTLISGDVDGDGRADFEVILDGALTLRQSDFILQ